MNPVKRIHILLPLCLFLAFLTIHRYEVFSQVKSERSSEKEWFEQIKNWPDLESPIDTINVSSNKIDFKWKSMGKGSKYNLQISRSGSFLPNDIIADTITSSYKIRITGLKNEAKFYWRVRAGIERERKLVWGRWSPLREFVLYWFPFLLPAPKLLFPPEEPIEHVACIPDHLQWTSVRGAEWYQVQIDNDISFTSLEQYIQILGTSCYIAAGLKGGVKYYWRVRAVRSYGPQYGLWSRVGYLWGLWAPIHANPFLLTPPDGSMNLMQPITLSWTSVPETKWYDVFVSERNSALGGIHLVVYPPSTSVQVNNLIYGKTYYWKVGTRNFCPNVTVSSTWSFTPYCPEASQVGLAAPANNASNLILPIQFMWYQLPGMVKYRFQADNNADFSSPELDQDVVEPYFNTSNLNMGTTYYWHVRGNNGCAWGQWSPVWQFTICPPLVSVTPVSPLNNTFTQIQTELKCVAQGSASKYQFQVAQNQTFSSPQVDQETTTPSIIVSGLSEGTSYYWRARAYNGCDWGPWCETMMFTVCKSLTTPILKSPIGGTVFCYNQRFFDWEDVQNATKYKIQVSSDKTFTSPVIDREATSSEYSETSYSSLYFSGKRYYWRVCASNQCEWGPWSAVDSLTTEFSSPINVSPPDGSMNMTEPITLSWEYETCTSGAGREFIITITNNSPPYNHYSFTTPTKSFVVTGLEKGKSYGWSVKFHCVVYTGDIYNPYRYEDYYSYGSQATYFSTFCPPAAAPSTILPLNGATGAGQTIGGIFTVLFDWSDIAGVQKYQIQVAVDQGFGSPVVDKERLESDCFCTNLTAGTLYYWRVRTFDMCGWGDWSPPATLTP